TRDRTLSLARHVSLTSHGSTMRFLHGASAVNGPGRTRTCDLGISEPSAVAARGWRRAAVVSDNERYVPYVQCGAVPERNKVPISSMLRAQYRPSQGSA